MTKENGISSAITHENLKIAHAIEQYVAKGGIINVLPEGEMKTLALEAAEKVETFDAGAQMNAKIEQLKGLVAKGAGVSALQYSLRMNRKEIKRLANENGLKIRYSRPVRGSRTLRSRDAATVDDTLAGHAMHYSTLGYTVPEIAQLLDLSVRDIWNLGKAYRFKFNSSATIDSSPPPSSDAPGSER